MDSEISTEIGFIDRRKVGRRSVDWEAFLTVPGLDGDVRCRVVDYSDAGARIEVASPGQLPGQFLMYINDLRDRRKCELAWQRDQTMGLAFAS